MDLRGRGTVLVIDDERTVREMCRDLLTPLGYAVLTAGDGEEGLRLYRERPDRVDVVLLDMVLPKLGGREVCEELRKIRDDARVIICSGYSPGGSSGLDALITTGARGLLQKPFTRQTVGTAIKEALEGALTPAGGRVPPPAPPEFSAAPCRSRPSRPPGR